MRSAFFLHGGERVSFKGSTRTAERREIDFTDGTRRMFWVIDELPALSSNGYLAPFPLETKEDARKYDREGLNGSITPAQLAARMGWKGGDAVSAAERFQQYIFAAMGGNERLMEIRRRDLGNVRLPGAAEVAEKRMDWRTLSAMIVQQGEDLEKLRAEVAELRGLVI